MDRQLQRVIIGSVLVVILSVAVVSDYVSSKWILVSCVSVMTFIFSSQTEKIKRQRALAAAKKRWEQHREADREYESSESFSVEWLNVAVGAIWPAFLEQYVSRIVKQEVQKKVDQLHRDNKLPSFLTRIEMEEFTLGTAPPRLTLGRMRSSPTRSYLQAAFDTQWTAVSYHVVVAVHLSPTALFPSLRARFEVTDLAVSGQVLLGLQLAPRTPGIVGIDFSFAERPVVDINIRPLGLSVADVPGIASWLNNMLVTLISRLFVEPKRILIPLERILLRQAARKSGGEGGLLTVTVIGAQNLACTGASPDLRSSAYCEVRFGGRVLRTHVVRSSQNPVWNRSFTFPLSRGHFLTRDKCQKVPRNCCTGAYATCQHCIVHLSCIDMDSSGEPTPLGSCEVPLESAWVPVGRASADTWLPLTPVSTGALLVRVAVIPPPSAKKFGQVGGPFVEPVARSGGAQAASVGSDMALASQAKASEDLPTSDYHGEQSANGSDAHASLTTAVEKGRQMSSEPGTPTDLRTDGLTARGSSVASPPHETSRQGQTAGAVLNTGATRVPEDKLTSKKPLEGAEAVEEEEIEEEDKLNAEAGRSKDAGEQVQGGVGQSLLVARRQRATSAGIARLLDEAKRSRRAGEDERGRRLLVEQRFSALQSEVDALKRQLALAQQETARERQKNEYMRYNQTEEFKSLEVKLRLLEKHFPPPAKRDSSVSLDTSPSTGTDPTASRHDLSTQGLGIEGTLSLSMTDASRQLSVGEAGSHLAEAEVEEGQPLVRTAPEGPASASKEMLATPSSPPMHLPAPRWLADPRVSPGEVVDMRLQIVALQGQLQECQALKVAAQAAALQHQERCVELEHQLSSFRDLRDTEECCAWVQGGLFIKHGRKGPALRRVWCSPSLDTLLWSAADSRGAPTKLLAGHRSIKLTMVDKVHPGPQYFRSDFQFPETTRSDQQQHQNLTDKSAKKKSAITSRSTKLFSVVFLPESSQRILNLEVPETGNGRSRDEWVRSLTHCIEVSRNKLSS